MVLEPMNHSFASQTPRSDVPCWIPSGGKREFSSRNRQHVTQTVSVWSRKFTKDRAHCFGGSCETVFGAIFMPRGIAKGCVLFDLGEVGLRNGFLL